MTGFGNGGRRLDNFDGSTVCVKRREDVKKVEEKEDCFILKFDPTDEESVLDQFDKLSVSVQPAEVFIDEDVHISYEKGQVACRDYPHPRHICAAYPFKKTLHEAHCKMCYCYVCDQPAPCKEWTRGRKEPSSKHCDATPDISFWRRQRDLKKQRSQVS